MLAILQPFFSPMPSHWSGFSPCPACRTTSSNYRASVSSAISLAMPHGHGIPKFIRGRQVANLCSEENDNVTVLLFLSIANFAAHKMGNMFSISYLICHILLMRLFSRSPQHKLNKFLRLYHIKQDLDSAR